MVTVRKATASRKMEYSVIGVKKETPAATDDGAADSVTRPRQKMPRISVSAAKRARGPNGRN